jgi:formate/nitrite transporter FocA (FNT family)
MRLVGSGRDRGDTVTGAHSSLDALLPAEMAAKAEEIGAAKAGMSAVSTLALAVLAGAFIALGAAFATTVASGASGVLPGGVTRLLSGFVFSLGLILVVVGGAELFTGNTLIIMAWPRGAATRRAHVATLFPAESLP